MSSPAETTRVAAEPRHRTVDVVRAGLKRRYAAERRFRLYGLAAILIALVFLALLLGTIVRNGYSAFQQTYIALDIHFDAAQIDPEGALDPEALSSAKYTALIRQSLRNLFVDVMGRAEQRSLYALVSSGAAFELRDRVLANPKLIGHTHRIWLLADDDVDMLVKGHMSRHAPETERRLKDHQIAWIDRLAGQGRVVKRFNLAFLAHGDSRQPEQAGVWGAVVGSFYTLFLTLVLSFPIGVAAAIYLEEFARRNWLTDLVEVNINNLAAVPSIVFGLLGLAVFINFFGLPRSAPIVGALVLSLLVLPTIIIASRAALKSVPPSIREAALAVGASKMQMIAHHVMPLAMPGMLTGTIIGMAHALGETAPLLMIGMVAFIVDIPEGILQPATVLPVQIFLWADSPERAFVERTSAAIMVLLLFLFLMNATAILLRKKFERRW
jgi:phosphate transport system permease protein